VFLLAERVAGYITPIKINLIGLQAEGSALLRLRVVNKDSKKDKRVESVALEAVDASGHISEPRAHSFTRCDGLKNNKGHVMPPGSNFEIQYRASRGSTAMFNASRPADEQIKFFVARVKLEDGTEISSKRYHVVDSGKGIKEATSTEEHEATTPQPAWRFRLRCATDSYSDNILVGNIPGRYLQVQITVSQAVSACKAYLREIRGGNRPWQGQEQLTFEPSEAPDSLSKAVFENITYRLDVLLLVSNGDIIVCNHNRTWARWPRLKDIFASHGSYDLVIDIGGENAAGETFKLRFDWNGNWQTSFLTSVKRLV